MVRSVLQEAHDSGLAPRGNGQQARILGTSASMSSMRGGSVQEEEGRRSRPASVAGFSSLPERKSLVDRSGNSRISLHSNTRGGKGTDVSGSPLVHLGGNRFGEDSIESLGTGMELRSLTKGRNLTSIHRSAHVDIRE